jgi:hypothetical protein
MGKKLSGIINYLNYLAWGMGGMRCPQFGRPAVKATKAHSRLG